MGWFRPRMAIRWATMLVLTAVAVAATACTTDGDSGADGDDPDGDDTVAADADTDANGASDGPPLEIVDAVSEVFCDGTDRLVGEIRGATPGEPIVISSPKPLQLTPAQQAATADADGAYRLLWRCDPSEAGQPWELRVRGEESGRRVTVVFTGTATDPDPDIDTTLRVTFLDEEFVCDGRTKPLGQLANAIPGESVSFTAARADDLIDGTADTDGVVDLTWQCRPGEAGTWEVTAQGLESERVGVFTIVGVAPDEIPEPVVQVDEDPFVCDGETRVFATLSGYLPDEVVEFTSPQSSAMVDGVADGTGALPIQWTCGAADVGTVWEITAAGVRSARTVTFTVTGGAPPPAPDPTAVLLEEPFRCDGDTRFVATLAGFAPREFIDFTSPQSEDLRQGQADEAGGLQVRWTCDAGDAGRVWEITATGATTERAVTFEITAG